MKLPVVFTCLALFATTLCGQSHTRFEALDRGMEQFTHDREIAGAVLLLASKDKLIHRSAVGVSDLATGRAMQVDDLFWIASMSKPITAVAVALLVDDGRLTFDTRVEDILPEFKNRWVADSVADDRITLVRAQRAITVRDLLTHTSGIGEYAVSAPDWSLALFTQVLSREPLAFQPGSKWNYSTAGIDVLGRIVEVVSGLPFDQFLANRLFQPLGMNDTSFWVKPEDLGRLASSYVKDASGALTPTPVRFMYGSKVQDRSRPPLGGAGLFSTATDIMKFYQMMLNQGVVQGRRILRAETIAELTRKQTGNLPSRPGYAWALGFSVVDEPALLESNRLLSVGTFGHAGAFGTNGWADPAQGFIYILMLQRDKLPSANDHPMRRRFQQLAAASLGKN